MQRGRGIETLRGNRETFEDIEDFNDVRPSGRGRRHRDDLVSTISPADWLALDGMVTGEVLDCHSPARRIDRVDDLLRHRPGVETPRALDGDRLKRRGKIVEREVIAGLREAAVGTQIDARRRRVAGKRLCRQRQGIDNIVVDGEALARKCDRRRD